MNAQKFLDYLSRGGDKLLGDEFKASHLIADIRDGVNHRARLDMVQQRYVIELLLAIKQYTKKTMARQLVGVQIATYINTCR